MLGWPVPHDYIKACVLQLRAVSTYMVKTLELHLRAITKIKHTQVYIKYKHFKSWFEGDIRFN